MSYTLLLQAYAKTNDVANAMKMLNKPAHYKMENRNFCSIFTATTKGSFANNKRRKTKELLFRGLRWADIRYNRDGDQITSPEP